MYNGDDGSVNMIQYCQHLQLDLSHLKHYSALIYDRSTDHAKKLDILWWFLFKRLS